MLELNDNNSQWLVKSGGRILGPFSIEEIIDQIKNRKISIIDEIKGPRERWLVIRDREDFQNIIEILKREHADFPEETIFTEVSDSFLLNEGTVTQIDNVANILEKTSSKAINIPSEAPMTNTADENFSSDHEETLLIRDDLPSASEKSKKFTPKFKNKIKSSDKKFFAYENDQNLKKSLKNESSLLVQGLLTATAVLVCFALYQGLVKKEIPLLLQEPNPAVKAHSLFSKGIYTKSYDYYIKTNPSTDYKSPEKLWDLLPLIISQGRSEAKQIISKIGPKIRIQKFPNESEFLRGLIFLNDGKYIEAETLFKKFQNSETVSLEAFLNIVISHYLQKRYDLVKNEIDNLKLKLNGNIDPLLFIIEGLLCLDQDFLKKNNGYLIKVYQDLDQFSITSPLYRKEFGFLISMISQMLSKGELLEKNIETLIEQFSYDHKLYGRSLYIDQQILAWPIFKTICQKMVSEKKDLPLFQALDSYCSYINGDLFQALDKVETLRKHFPDQVRFIGWHSYLLNQLDRPSEAKALLMISNAKTFKIAKISEAILTFNDKEYSRSESIWEEVMQLDPLELRSYSGLAKVHLATKDRVKARNVIQKGLLLMPTFIPLLEIQEELNEK